MTGFQHMHFWAHVAHPVSSAYTSVMFQSVRECYLSCISYQITGDLHDTVYGFGLGPGLKKLVPVPWYLVTDLVAHYEILRVINENFVTVNTLRPRQNGRHFPDDILKMIFFNKNVWISIEISLKFVPEGQINNIPALVQIMAWHRPGDKPLSEPIMVSLLTHICVTRPQWVKIKAWQYHKLFYINQWEISTKQSSHRIIVIGFIKQNHTIVQNNWLRTSMYCYACFTLSEWEKTDNLYNFTDVTASYRISEMWYKNVWTVRSLKQNPAEAPVISLILCTWHIWSKVFTPHRPTPQPPSIPLEN